LVAVEETTRVFVNRFSCETESAARELVNQLLVAGLFPELRAPQAAGGRWEIVAPAELVPTPDNLEDLQGAMHAAADRSRASYDGCDTGP
jgi:hypothetical protein